MLCARPGRGSACVQHAPGAAAQCQPHALRAFPHSWQPVQRPKRLRPCRAGRRNSGREETMVAVDPDPLVPPTQTPWTHTWQAKGAAAALLLFAAGKILGQLRRNQSVSDLEERGYLDDSRDNNDPYLEDIMRNVNKVQYEELSEEQIAAARKRRARGVPEVRKKEAEVEIPDDHPFATKQDLSPEEEELARKRLEVKRGLPLQDLAGRRGFPGDGQGDNAAAA